MADKPFRGYRGGKKRVYRALLSPYFDDWSDAEIARLFRKGAAVLEPPRGKGRPPKNRKTIVQEALAQNVTPTKTVELIRDGIFRAESLWVSSEAARSALRKYQAGK